MGDKSLIKLEQPINILVHRRGALGDVVMTTPIVRALYEMYEGDADIYVSTDATEVYKHNPYVKGVYKPGAVPDIKFSSIFDLDDVYEMNPKNYFVDSFAYHVFGNTEINQTLDIYLTPDETVEVMTRTRELVGGDPYIVVHMRGWAWPNKNMATQSWIDLVEAVIERWPNLKIVQIGTDADNFLDGHENLVNGINQFGIRESKALIAGAQAYIGSDSATFHIAGATNTPIIGLLTHLTGEGIMPRREGDYKHKTVTVYPDVECIGCYYDLPRPVRQMTCRHGDFRCNKLFDVADIMSALEQHVNA
jgi:ADP-heptose:LPS heptosyltransferase